MIKETKLLFSQIMLLIVLLGMIFFLVFFLKSQERYIVSFNSSGGSRVSSQLIWRGKKASLPTPPKKEGYTFLGWYENDVRFDFEKNVYFDIQLKAKWEKI